MLANRFNHAEFGGLNFAFAARATLTIEPLTPPANDNGTRVGSVAVHVFGRE